MPAKPIDRISMPDDETFFREYVFKRKPVIITNLFDGEEIREIQSLEQAQKAFGAVKLSVNFGRPKPGAPATETITFDEFCDSVKALPSTNLWCSEYEIPARIMAQFKLPGVCAAGNRDEEEILSLPRKYGDHDLSSNLFVANKGFSANLHWDGDHRQVFLYQVFGRKHVILFQPESVINLNPLEGQVPFSGISLECMTEEEKLAFVNANDGYYGTIYPTEAIYMPMLIWHHLEYADDAMSFNIRFGRNKYGRFLCVDNFHRDYYIQCFASKLADTAVCDHQYKAVIDSVIDKYLEPTTDLSEKIKDMRKLLKELCAEIIPEARMEECCPPEREEEEIEKIIKDIGHTMRYTDPNIIKQLRPVGPITTRQIELIEKNALKYGYPPGALRHLLLNRLGKTDIDTLTKVEAAHFLSYLKSPGASWPS